MPVFPILIPLVLAQMSVTLGKFQVFTSQQTTHKLAAHPPFPGTASALSTHPEAGQRETCAALH